MSICAKIFEEQAREREEAIAVEMNGEQVTYGELNRRANQLGNYLRRRGIGREDLVGVCMGRSVEQLESMIGIMKAGGGYVPMDPGYPRERLEYMREDGRLKVVLTGEKWEGGIGEGRGEVVRVEKEREEIGRESEEEPEVRVERGEIAYVIYTSGTTGRPKGVEVEHVGLVNLVKWHEEEFEVGREDRRTEMAGQLQRIGLVLGSPGVRLSRS